MAFPHIVSKCFVSSAASVLVCTVCIVPLILGSTVARAQEGSMPSVGGEIVLAQQTNQAGRRIGTPKSQQKDPMSWKDILNKGYQSAPGTEREGPSTPESIIPGITGPLPTSSDQGQVGFEPDRGANTMGGGMRVDTGDSAEDKVVNRFFGQGGHGPGYTRVGDRRQHSNNPPTEFYVRLGLWTTVPFLGQEQVGRVPDGGVGIEDGTVGAR
jgi:hypothetical protein